MTLLFPTHAHWFTWLCSSKNDYMLVLLIIPIPLGKSWPEFSVPHSTGRNLYSSFPQRRNLVPVPVYTIPWFCDVPPSGCSSSSMGAGLPLENSVDLWTILFWEINLGPTSALDYPGRAGISCRLSTSLVYLKFFELVFSDSSSRGQFVVTAGQLTTWTVAPSVISLLTMDDIDSLTAAVHPPADPLTIVLLLAGYVPGSDLDTGNLPSIWHSW